MSAFYGISLQLHLPLSLHYVFMYISINLTYSKLPSNAKPTCLRKKRVLNISRNSVLVLNKYDPKLPSALAETSWFKSRAMIKPNFIRGRVWKPSFSRFVVSEFSSLMLLTRSLISSEAADHRDGAQYVYNSRQATPFQVPLQYPIPHPQKILHSSNKLPFPKHRRFYRP